MNGLGPVSNCGDRDKPSPIWGAEYLSPGRKNVLEIRPGEVLVSQNRVEQGSAEFPAFGNSAALLEERTAEFERQNSALPGSDQPGIAVTGTPNPIKGRNI
jgi:hypothetical protein